MELSKVCPVQRLVHEYQAMIPVGVPANGLVAANAQQGMRMEFRGIVQNHHELEVLPKESEFSWMLYCRFCGRTAPGSDWFAVINDGMSDDAPTHKS